MSDSVRPHRWKPTRLPCPWDSPGKNTGVGCHFLLQCTKVKSESEVAQLCPTLSDPMDCSLPGSSIHGIFQARVLEWGAIALSVLNIHISLCLWLLKLSICTNQLSFSEKTNRTSISFTQSLSGNPQVRVKLSFFFFPPDFFFFNFLP